MSTYFSSYNADYRGLAVDNIRCMLVGLLEMGCEKKASSKED